MSAIEYAKQLIKNGKPYPLAIHIASVKYNVSTKEISAQFAELKKAKQQRLSAKAKYQSTVPAWQKQINDN